MPDVILADNNRFMLKSLKRHINKRIKHFEVVETFQDPAYPSIDKGDLVSFLRDKTEYDADNPVYLVLDMNFGGDQYQLGLDIVRYLMQSTLKDRVRILIATGLEDRMLFEDLVNEGVMSIVRKDNIGALLAEALQNASRNTRFGDNISFVRTIPDTEQDEIERVKIAREIAKGFRNTFLESKKGGFASVTEQKKAYRDRHIHELCELKNDVMHPTSPKEWNDVWFLLHHLKNSDREVKRFVEQMCNITITYRS